jgi:hypothetical protein
MKEKQPGEEGHSTSPSLDHIVKEAAIGLSRRRLLQRLSTFAPAALGATFLTTRNAAASSTHSMHTATVQGSSHSAKPNSNSGCQTFYGSCSGIGGSSCVEAYGQSGYEVRCCNGWFQYAWLTVNCPGQFDRGGCGFCV